MPIFGIWENGGNFEVRFSMLRQILLVLLNQKWLFRLSNKKIDWETEFKFSAASKFQKNFEKSWRTNEKNFDEAKSLTDSINGHLSLGVSENPIFRRNYQILSLFDEWLVTN